MSKEVAFELGVIDTKFVRSMANAIKTAARFDAQMASLQRTGKAVDKALKAIEGDVDIKVNADVNTGGIRSQVEGMSALDIDVTGDVNTAAIRTDIEGMTAAEVPVKAGDVSTAPIRSGVEGMTPASAPVKPKLDPSSKSLLQRSLDSIGSGLSVAVKVTAGAAVAGAATAAAAAFPIVSTIQDQQAAERLLQSQAEGSAEAIAAVNDAYQEGYASSRLEIAAVAVALERAGAESETFGDSLKSALQVMTVQGTEAEETFMALDALIASGFADSYQEAANILTTGFNSGLNKAGDFLGAVVEFSPQFADAEMSASGFLGILESGLDAGAKDVSKLGDLFLELNNRVGQALADTEGTGALAPFKALLGDEAEMTLLAFKRGEMTGAELLAGMVEAAQSPAQQQALKDALGSPAEDLTVPVLAEIDYGASIDISSSAASDAADAFNDTLSNDIKRLGRVVETTLAESFRISGKSVTEFVEDSRLKLQTLTDALQNGTALPEALEIALEAPGLSDKIRDLEAGLGNFIIEFQLAVASVLDVLRQGDAAANIRASVANQAEGQLQYEVKFADNDIEVAEAITRAMRRGVDAANIPELLATPVSELLNAGEFDKAQAIIDQINSLRGEVQVKISAANGSGREAVITVPVDPELTPEAREEYIKSFVLTTAEASEIWNLQGQRGPFQVTEENQRIDVIDTPEIDTVKLQKQINEARTQIQTDMSAAFDAAFLGEPGSGGINDAIGTAGWLIETLGNNASEAGGRLDGFSSIAAALKVPVDQLWKSNNDLVEALEKVNKEGGSTARGLAAAFGAEFPGLFASLEELEKHWLDVKQAAFDAYVAQGGKYGITPPQLEGRATGGEVVAGQAYRVGEQGEELFVPGMDGAIIPHGLSQAMLSLPALVGGSSSSVINNTVHANININSQNSAQLMGAGTRMARAIRGY